MSQVQHLRVEALSPLLFRDARPFGASADETRARSLLLPGPSTIAGLVRTFVGEQLGWDWRNPTSVEQAKAIRILGSHVVREESGRATAVLPAPATAVPYLEPADGTPAIMRLSPGNVPPGHACDLPEGLTPLSVTQDVKPVSGYGLWQWSDCERWLAGETIVPTLVEAPPIDERVNIAVDPATSTAAEGMLFVTEYRAWETGDNTPKRPHVSWALVVGIDGPELDATTAVAHFGGDRRPVAITRDAAAPAPLPGPELLAALTASTRLTMQLVTPALFDHGWRPGWLSVPGTLHPALSGAAVISAAVGRHETVAGWNHDLRQRGPKATRWAVPAGSTYFLQLPRPLTEQQVRELWLRSVSDDTTDQNDGYGNAVWGVWDQ